MIDELLEALRVCRSERQAWPIEIGAECRLTPGEVFELVARREVLPPVIQKWAESLERLVRLSHDGPPQRFLRRALAAGADLYSDPMPRDGDKVLIIGFCGNADRLMVPIAALLQALSSDRCDLLVLRDIQKAQFLNGVEGYAESMFDLAKRISEDFGDRYSRFYCLGTSNGGFGALRCGVLMNVHTAISVGGRSQWYVRGLIDDDTAEMPAFDPLCMSVKLRRTRLVCAYAADNEVDRKDADRLAAFLPIKRWELPDSATHNILFAFLQGGQLRATLHRIFDLGRP